MFAYCTLYCEACVVALFQLYFGSDGGCGAVALS